MKAFVLLATLLVFYAAPQLSLHADPGTTLADFSNKFGFSYGYEGWKDLGSIQTPGADSVHLVGPAAGGAGLLLDKLQDVTGSKFLCVKIKRAPIANHSDLLVKLFDGGGKTTQWIIKAADIPTDDFKVIKLPFDAKPTLDLEEIKQIQIQGTFNPFETVDFNLASITSA